MFFDKVGKNNMLQFTYNDKKEINEAYKIILFNLKSYLQQYHVESGLEYSKIIFYMLHNGFFSIDRKIRFDNYYNYLGLTSKISQGVQVMYGICCCRHATDFLYDLLCVLGFNPSRMFILIEDNTGIWRKVNPAIQKTNHIVIEYFEGKERYIIDPRNEFILQILENEELKQLDTKYFDSSKSYKDNYQDDNIAVVARILRKYYTCRELGVTSIY